MLKRANVLFFLTDDQRFDTIQVLGNPSLRTHIPGGTCGAVCMPSRAMIHSGRSLFHLADQGQEIPTDHTTLDEAFRQASYACHGIGKWHNGRKAYARSFNSTEEIFFAGMSDHWDTPAHQVGQEFWQQRPDLAR